MFLIIIYSDGSDESSCSNSSSSSSEKRTPKKKNETKPQGANSKKVLKVEKKSPIKEKSQNVELKKVSKSRDSSSGKVLKTKHSLVSQLLKRWWYALPKWPPENFDTRYIYLITKLSEALIENKLKQIEKSEWKIEPNIDDKGFKKCIELDGYKFVYIDYLGKIHDLRPRDSIPSFNNFAKKSEKELYQLLIKALKNQIETLEKEEKYSEEDYTIIESLKDELKFTESNYARI